MRLGSKITAFFLSLSIIAGVYFFSLPTQQIVCAQASAACSATGGSCVDAYTCEQFGGSGTPGLGCSAANVCCVSFAAAGLPPEAEKIDKSVTTAKQTNTPNSGYWFAEGFDANLGQLVRQLAKKNEKDGSLGALSAASSLTSQLYSRPVASSTEYIADVFQSIKHPFGEQTAYAQGLGFSALNPVLSLWKLFRNVAYFFYVIIFMAVGVMIMLRQKIGGQAAATVQQMLPKLVISLLLVTFSYAIAGLMLDLMYIGIYLMIGIFQTNGSLDNNLSIGTLTDIAFKRNIFTNVWNLMAGGTVGSVSTSVGTMVTQLIDGNQDASVSVGKIVGGATNVIVFLVIAVALLVNIFRLFFTLLKAYASIFIGVIFAPIQLLLGTFSGQNAFIGWIKGLAKNIVVFPTVILLLFIANYFAFRPGQDAANPTVGGFSAPQLGSNQGAGGIAAFAMLQFAIIAMIPKAAELASDAVDGKMSVDPGKAIGEFAKQGLSGGEVIPGFKQSNIAGVTNAYSAINRDLYGTAEHRKKQREIKQLNPLAEIERGGLSSVMNKPISTIRGIRSWNEQRAERKKQSIPPPPTGAGLPPNTPPSSSDPDRA